MAQQELIIPSKNIQIWLTYGNLSLRITTASRLGKTFAQTIENLYGIGFADPIGIAESTASYTSSISIQTGEYQVLLNAINATLPAGTNMYASFLQVPSFNLTVTYAMDNLITPSTATWTLQNCRVSEDSEDITANDPATYVSLGLQGTGIRRSVAPIPSN